jgi:hypothetical protein
VLLEEYNDKSGFVADIKKHGIIIYDNSAKILINNDINLNLAKPIT